MQATLHRHQVFHLCMINSNKLPGLLLIVLCCPNLNWFSNALAKLGCHNKPASVSIQRRSHGLGIYM